MGWHLTGDKIYAPNFKCIANFSHSVDKMGAQIKKVVQF